jgi:hypothetical protein
MQIHEITHKQRLDEVDIIGGIKGAVAGFQQSQQQRQVQQNTAALAKTALQQWNNKVIQLTQAAGGQPVDEKEYKTYLTDFVQKVMLGNKSIDNLDAASKPRIQKAIDDVVAGRNDRNKLSSTFNELVTQATVARTTPTKAQAQSGGIQAKIENKDPLQVTVNGVTYQTDQDANGAYSPWVEFQTGKPAPATITTWLQKNLQKIDPADTNLQKVADAVAGLAKAAGAQGQGQGTMTRQQAVSAVDQFMQQGISGAQQAALKTFLQQTAGTPAVSSTGNPVTDALLNQLGIKTT